MRLPWRWLFVRNRLLRRGLLFLVGLVVLTAGTVWYQTATSLLEIPSSLPPNETDVDVPRFSDRTGTPLSSTYRNRWNVHDRVAYHDVPPLLRRAFVEAEDQRFFDHGGVDWLARLHAVAENLRARRGVRGASTISEQAVRILHPRPRTVWSRWLEGFEAVRLEKRFSKVEILEFYLNQVPYARQRRGVLQAAKMYFARDLDTLSVGETLALAVLVRSPSRLDLIRGTEAIRPPLERLARRMLEDGWLSEGEHRKVLDDPLAVVSPAPRVEAAHFLAFARRRPRPGNSAAGGVLRTSLDASLQARVQEILDRRLAGLAAREVGDGAVLVVDHQSREILAWVNGGGFSHSQIDNVTTPRQPGSTLKPFVYALALERGMTASTLIDDAPLARPVGHGLHSYRNYSRGFYGPLPLRQALANSLNTPAVRVAATVGRDALLERLRWAGFTTLTQHPDWYGDGLALGTGEVTLYALVRAYAALARGGELVPLRGYHEEPEKPYRARRIFDPETSSIIANILSDARARELEFGQDSLLNLPVAAAVKTGTSNDYRDAWTVGFSHRYTVGVWMGNQDRRPMREVTGSLGPALVLRSVFAELHRHVPSRPLYLSRRLTRRSVCLRSGASPSPRCPRGEEWFRPGKKPPAYCPLHCQNGGDRSARGGTTGLQGTQVRIKSPTPGLHLARDPRIPDARERFELEVETAPGVAVLEWWLDGELVATRGEGVTSYAWPVSGGRHVVQARVRTQDGTLFTSQRVTFIVK